MGVKPVKRISTRYPETEARMRLEQEKASLLLERRHRLKRKGLRRTENMRHPGALDWQERRRGRRERTFHKPRLKQEKGTASAKKKKGLYKLGHGWGATLGESERQMFKKCSPRKGDDQMTITESEGGPWSARMQSLPKEEVMREISARRGKELSRMKWRKPEEIMPSLDKKQT